MKIILRDYIEDSDAGLIYDSCPKGVYFGALAPIEQDKAQWMIDFYSKLRQDIQHAKIHIACLKDDPNTILGYSIIKDDKLEFVYVKDLYRKQGIATLLTKNKFKSISRVNLTKIGAAILKAHPELEEKEENGTEEAREERIETSHETSSPNIGGNPSC